MKSFRQWLLLLLIFALAAFLRFYKLGTTPNGLYQDETAIGYNAYSIIDTGKDEHGASFPLYFKSFGDYKLPIYIYLTAISVKLFGLNEWAVRFPSAFFGTLTILVLYLLISELFKKPQLAILTTLLLSINPWHLHYSRATFEVTLALFFFVFGGYLIHIALEQKKSWKFLFGTLFFVIAVYTYNLTRLLSPLLFLVFLWAHQDKIKGLRKNELLLTALVSIILLVPFFSTLLTKAGTASAGGTFIFTSAAVQAPLLEFRSYLISLPSFLVKLFFNQLALTKWFYANNVARYLSVDFFFINGSAHGNHGIGNVGEFYLFELPLILIGILQLIKQKILVKRIILGWIIATVAVASLTREAPHATRSFFLIFPLITLSALGLVTFLSWLSQYRSYALKFLAIGISVGVVTYNLIYYFSSYYVRFPVAYAAAWRSADKPLALYLKSVESRYDRILIDPEAGLIYTSLLFYQSFPPQGFLDSVKWTPDDSEGFSTVEKFGKYEFRPIQWERDYKTPRTLIVTTPKRTPPDIPILQSFSYPKRPVVIAIKQDIAQYPVEDVAYVAIASAQ